MVRLEQSSYVMGMPVTLIIYTEMKMWRLWAKALGEKVGQDKEADTVAIIRTLIVLQAVICNGLIVWNIIRKW
tara:strand:+ start:156 stop:374 length:219 start_codon:yes stop_codon:yes gene_type:complete